MDNEYLEGVGMGVLSTDAVDHFDDKSPVRISGVAIPVNTIVNGGQGVDHFFPPEVLKRGSDLLEGKPIVKNFHDIDGQANADQVIGKVTNSGFQKGVGLVFEGEISDMDIAEKVAHGFLDVSPSPARSLGEFDDAMGAQRVDRLVDFRDIAVVANGQPGAQVEIGPNPAIEALSRDALAHFDTLETDMTPPEQAQTNAQAVLDIQDKTDAMTDTGWARANQLADGEQLSADVIERMAQFNRHRDNAEFGNFADIPEDRKSEDAENPWWEDNGTVAWLGWGGDAGVDWAIERSEEMQDTNQEKGLNLETLQENVELELTSVEPGDVENYTDSEWDGPGAISGMPNPSDSDDAPGILDQAHLVHPVGEQARGDKSNWKLPFRTGPDAPVNTRALVAAKAAIQGARGGVEGISLNMADNIMDRIDAFLDDAPDDLFGADGEEEDTQSGHMDEEDTMQSDDGTHGVWSQSSAAATKTNNSNMTEISDEERSVLRAAETIEDPIEVLNAYAAAEQPEIVESDALARKDEQIDELAGVFREVLKAKKDLKDETVDALSVEGLTAEFRNEDGELEPDTLSQVPETGQVSAPSDDSEDKPVVETLSLDERKKAKNLKQKIDLLTGRASEDHVDALRSDFEELTGDSPENVEVDAL